jgi:hypothetical protein
MASLPRPLIGLLVATLAAFGLWYVELRPSSSAGGSSQGGVGQYQSAINQAHQAVKISGAANARLGSPTSTGPGPNSPTPAKTATAAKAATATATAVKPATKGATATKTAIAAKSGTAAKSATTKTKAATAKPAAKTLTTAQQVSLITSAIESHKVVAVLFYNASAADDQAMAKELGTVSTHGGQVVSLAVPLSELTNFSIITQQIPVVTAPTLILIDADRQATTLTGFADTVEISQRIDDALAAK